jgi:glycosyltransferase
MKVSICCITYNHGKYIRKAIDSFLAQKRNFDIEILINDDASTDDTANIIREYQEKYPDIIKPLFHEENMYSQGVTNPSGTYNFPRATGKYIAMCEGDDYWCDENKLQIQVDYMEDHSEISFCFHAAKVENLDATFSPNLIRPYESSGVISAKEVINKRTHYPTASLLLRTEYMKDLPKYYFECKVGDIPMQIISAKYGDAYYIDKVMSVYRMGVPTSWTASQFSGDYKRKQEEYYQNMEVMYKVYDEDSKYRFHTEVESATKRLRFLTYVNIRDFKNILSREFKKEYKELDFRERFFIKFEYLLPMVYKLVRKAALYFKR